MRKCGAYFKWVMLMRVLLSIRPVHVSNILDGSKTFEFRRKVFARRDIRSVIIYCTMPVGKIVGEFDLEAILEEEPEALWRITRKGSGISKEYFNEYFSGRPRAFALKIGKVHAYSKHILPSELLPNFTPPQSYMYIDRSNADLRINRQCSIF